MGRILIAVLTLALLSGCAVLKKKGAAGKEEHIDIPSRDGDRSQAFSLPGVPLKFMPPPAREKAPPAPEKENATAAAPTGAPQAQANAPAAAPEETLAAQNTPEAEEELQFHVGAAKKYYSKKQYKSAAAEYGAALRFVPAGDPRAVNLLERQGAMLLRADNCAKAGEIFRGAIKKAKDLNSSGKDLANSHLGLGYCLEKQSVIPEAIENYERARELSTGKTARARIAKTIRELKAANKPAK